MKLRAIRLENVRRFTAPHRVDDIGDGLNVLAAPNEQGKSTLFEALEIALSYDRKSQNARVQSLVPYAGGSPRVTVAVETEEGRFTIDKLFARGRGSARVFSGEGRLMHQADDAEAWISALMAPREKAGPGALLWVRQGAAGLGRTEKETAARQTMLSAIAGEIGSMTGGRRMEVIRAKVAADLGRYLTDTGRVKKNGPLDAAEADVAAYTRQLEEARAAEADLNARLKERGILRRELADLERPEDAADRARNLREAEAAHRASEGAQQVLRAAEAEVATLAAQNRIAGERLAALDAQLAERTAALDAVSVSQKASAELETEVDKARRAEGAARDRANAAADAHGQSARALKALRQARERGEAAERRAALVTRLDQAETLETEARTLSARAAQGPGQDRAGEIERLVVALRVAEAREARRAPSLVMHYAPGAPSKVHFEGAPMPDGAPVPVPGGGRVHLPGIGVLEVRLPEQEAGPGESDLQAAQSALQAALEALGFDTVEDMRAAAAEAAEAARRAAEARAERDGLAPEGLDALRTAMAASPADAELEATLPTDADLAAAEGAEASAREELEDSRNERERATVALQVRQEKQARATAVLEEARGRMARAEAALAGADPLDDRRAALHAEAVRTAEALAAARDGLTRQREAAPDNAAVAARLSRARSAVAEADTAAQEIRRRLAGLDAAIELRAGDSVVEERVEIEERLTAATHRHAALLFETDVLKRLAGALDAAQAGAQERFLRPVTEELAPLAAQVWGDAGLVLDPETLLPEALVRDGLTELHDKLSGGTQEQIALLVRLAFARLMARAGTAPPVIIDDGIVFTDDERIEAIFDALTRQAADVQILVLTCRQRAFRALGGTALRIQREAPDDTPLVPTDE